MRETLIPLPFFLDAAIRAGGLRHRIDGQPSLVPRYVGIVVVLIGRRNDTRTCSMTSCARAPASTM
jgi:hypothetical protein